MCLCLCVRDCKEIALVSVLYIWWYVYFIEECADHITTFLLIIHRLSLLYCQSNKRNSKSSKVRMNSQSRVIGGNVLSQSIEKLSSFIIQYEMFLHGLVCGLIALLDQLKWCNSFEHAAERWIQSKHPYNHIMNTLAHAETNSARSKDSSWLNKVYWISIARIYN